MPIYKTYEKESFRWGIWKADETLEELALLMPHGDVCMQESIQRFSNENRRKEWLAVRVLLSYLSEKEYEIAYCPSGKPYLKDSSCRISVSHTNGYVAVALHPLHEVGIDIERYATRVMKVKERLISFLLIPSSANTSMRKGMKSTRFFCIGAPKKRCLNYWDRRKWI